MLIALAAVLAVWVLLPGGVFLLHRQLGLGRWPSVVTALFGWLVCAGLALVVLGPGWQGKAGAAGMLVPLAAAVLVAFA